MELARKRLGLRGGFTSLDRLGWLDLVLTYGEEMVREAVILAGEQGGSTFRYVRTILERSPQRVLERVKAQEQVQPLHPDVQRMLEVLAREKGA